MCGCEHTRNKSMKERRDKVDGKKNAVVDFATYVFYKELAERYPETKVNLTVHSTESGTSHSTTLCTI